MNKKVMYIGLFIIAALISIALFASGNNSSITKVSGNEARDILAQHDTAYLVDVRTAAEYSASHIDGSILIPLDSVKQTIESTIVDKDAHIIVYCRSGNRSGQAAKLLEDLGYTNIYDLGAKDNW